MQKVNKMSEFSLQSLFSLVCGKKKLCQLGLLDKFVKLQKEPAVVTLRRHHALVFEWQVAFNFWFILLQKKKTAAVDVVYDGSQSPGQSTSAYWMVTLSRRGKAKRQRVFWTDETRLPLKRLRFPVRHVEEDLCRLLSHLLSAEDHQTCDPPSDYQSTRAWLQRFGLWNRVVIRYCTILLPRKCYVDWIETEADKAGQVLAVLEAFVGKTGRLTFAQYNPPPHPTQEGKADRGKGRSAICPPRSLLAGQHGLCRVQQAERTDERLLFGSARQGLFEILVRRLEVLVWSPVGASGQQGKRSTCGLFRLPH